MGTKISSFLRPRGHLYASHSAMGFMRILNGRILDYLDLKIHTRAFLAMAHSSSTTATTIYFFSYKESSFYYVCLHTLQRIVFPEQNTRTTRTKNPTTPNLHYLSIHGFILQITSNLRFPTIPIGQQLLFIVQQLLMCLCCIFKIWALHNGIHWACLLTEATEDALGHV